MTILSTSYSKTPEFDDPQDWLKKISFYTGILEQLSRQNEVISIERINYEGEYKQNDVDYRFIRLKNKTVLFPWRMHRIIKKMKPDVVMINGFIFPLQIIQLRLKLGKGVKIIVINRAEKPSSGFRKILQRLADRYVHAYLFTSNEMGAEWTSQGIIADKKKIAGIIGASSSFFCMSKEKALAKTNAAGHPVFLWVGRLDNNKDPMTVLKAFGQFINHRPSAKLYMIYQTEELKREIDHLCEMDSNLQKAVTMVGSVAHEELQFWYNSADFIISGSHYEGSGVAVCEAMSCGCVPVVTDIQSFRKMTGPGKCGLLYEPGNEKELLAALLQTHELDLEKEKEKTMRQFNEELSFEAIARKINGIIATLSIEQAASK